MEKFKSFMAKVGDWFKQAGCAIGRWAKNVWENRNEPIKPVVAWAVIGGVVVIAVAIALIIWL